MAFPLVVFLFVCTPRGKRGSDVSVKRTASIFTGLPHTCPPSVLGTHPHWLGTSPILLPSIATIEQNSSRFPSHFSIQAIHTVTLKMQLVRSFAQSLYINYKTCEHTRRPPNIGQSPRKPDNCHVSPSL